MDTNIKIHSTMIVFIFLLDSCGGKKTWLPRSKFPLKMVFQDFESFVTKLFQSESNLGAGQWSDLNLNETIFLNSSKRMKQIGEFLEFGVGGKFRGRYVQGIKEENRTTGHSYVSAKRKPWHGNFIHIFMGAGP